MKIKFKRMLQADTGAAGGTAPAEPVPAEPVTKEPVSTEVEPVKGAEVEPQKVEEPTIKHDETIKNLEAELEKLRAEISNKAALEETTKKLESDLNQLKTDHSSSAAKVTEYEALVDEIVNSKLNSIPEKFRELVPSNLSHKEKLNWINKAEESGLFAAAKAVEIGKPMNPAPAIENIDFKNVSPTNLMAMAYANKK